MFYVLINAVAEPSMTLVAGWVRSTINGAEELVFASDSRLTNGGELDCCPKIFTLPRTDSVLAFAGDTFFAYPLIIQIQQAIQQHTPLKNRAIDYRRFRNHMMRIFNSMISQFANYVPGLEHPQTAFLVGGYSWFYKEFKLDLITYDKSIKQFVKRSCESGIGNFGKVLFAGDKSKEAYRRLLEMLKERHGVESVSRTSKVSIKFHMEPFEVLRDLLRENKAGSSIGGPPQITTVSQHMNTMQTAVYWPSKQDGSIYLGGRPIFDYENIDSWVLDPDTFQKEHQVFNWSNPHGNGTAEAPEEIFQK